MKLEQIIKLKLNNFEIKYPNKMAEDEMENPCQSGYEPIGMKEKDGRMVPNCVKIEQSKQDFVIPSPRGDEDESAFIGRCNSELYNEFPDDAQRNAVCYKSWTGE